MATTPVSLAIAHQLLGVLDAVGDRDLDQHVLAGAHHLLALPEVHLGGRGQDHRVGALDAFAEIAGVMRHAVFLGDLGGGVLVAADQRGDLDALDALERVEMLLTEGALAGDANLHHFPLAIRLDWCCARRRAWSWRQRLLLPAGLPVACRRLAARFSRMMCPTAVLEAGTV